MTTSKRKPRRTVARKTAAKSRRTTAKKTTQTRKKSPAKPKSASSIDKAQSDAPVVKVVRRRINGRIIQQEVK